jgi:trimethylamine--corrinoid protein Co-methyltransferase
MQHEVISYVESMMRELDLSDDALGLDVIEEVGPGGTFIDQVHTAQHFRKELWFPKLLDRNYYQAWLDDGAKSMEQRCREEKERILETHIVDPVSAEVDRTLDEIVAAAKRDLEKY